MHETFEPGAGATGAVIRELLLHGPETIEPTAEALLMAADRAQHVAAQIEPALARGEWVVCDRYVPSSLVYQGVVRGLGVDLVEQLSTVATRGPRARPRARVRRLRRRRGARARATNPTVSNAKASSSTPPCDAPYRDLAPARGWVVLDGNGDLDAVGERVRAAVAAVAGRMTA